MLILGVSINLYIDLVKNDGGGLFCVNEVVVILLYVLNFLFWILYMELMGVLLGNIDFLMFKIIFEKNFWDNVFVLILFFL